MRCVRLGINDVAGTPSRIHRVLLRKAGLPMPMRLPFFQAMISAIRVVIFGGGLGAILCREGGSV
jgi:hypothetical protein